MFQVAKPAVNQATRTCARAAGDVALFDKADFEPSQRSIPRDPGTIDSATDNDEIPGAGFSRFGNRNLRASPAMAIPATAYGRVWPLPRTTYL